jgi:AcrR family transcriptional regulator
MPSPRFKRLAPDRQRDILVRAAEEFAAHGYQLASLNHLINELGLSKGVFYYYFDSKADLFGAVLQMVWDDAMPKGGLDPAALDASSFWPTLEHLIRYKADRCEEQPWLNGISRLMMSPPAAPDLSKVVADVMERANSWAMTLLKRGQEVGVVRTDIPLDVLFNVVMAVDQAVDRWLLDNWDGLSPEERAAAAMTTFDLWRRMAAPAMEANHHAPVVGAAR